ncbi:UvrD-helicase domain-containing protein [Marininema halotolerans]|uniref:DNA 3'-5' helicase n=1 Tax=Marininema halotolerans TaxID=1155944 RepID=A0A1I6RR56_9BACL|nr:UvrD-helicase domain-containing protein [Marininema halotolerans]SFS67175.1 ATP-dependent exoDNAse (exonuclease V) beta subunit (contains helicase and exonuclease domains) [Marininema halotolerans]
MAEWQMTAEQEEAVHCLDQDCIVSAGAGSGKTRVLVERYLTILQRHLMEDDPLSKVVAMTFTEKAATEMIKRVREGITLRLRLAQEKGHTLEGDRWYEILSDMERARISTIHSFCADVLREFPVQAKIDPDFRVLDEWEAHQLRQKAITNMLTEWLSTSHPASVPMERLLLRWGITGTKDRLDQLSLEMSSHGWEPGQLADFTLKDIQQTKNQLVMVEQELLNQVLMAGDEMLSLKGGKLCTRFQLEWGRLKKALQSEGDAHGRIGPLVEIKALLRGNWGKKEEIIVPKERLKEVHMELLSVSEGLAFIHEEDEIASYLLMGMESLHQQYKKEKQWIGGLDFDDLQSLTIQLLQQSPKVAHKIRGSVRYLMVDEYQDTNESQKQLIDLLLPGPQGEHIPGKWFVVGDAKQSIYRFRGADVSVFGRTKEEMVGGGGKEVALLDNFRSEASLVEFSNALFSRLMSTDPRNDNFFRKTRAHRVSEEEGRIEFLPIPTQVEEDPRAWEAYAIADRIKDLLTEGVLPGSIAILLQAMTHVKEIERALKQKGIPYYVAKGDGFFQRQEILDLYHLLRYLANPSDRLACIGVLRSPFCGISDDTLYRMSRSEEWERQWLQGLDSEGLLPEEQRKLSQFQELFSRWQGLCGRISVAELVERAVYESGYLHVSWGLHHGPQVAANVDKFLQLLRQWQGEFPYSVQSVCRVIEQGIQAGIKETEAKIEAEDGESVKLMTIHQSKGLEFPIVFIPDLSRKLPPDTTDVKVDRASGLVFCLPGVDLSRMETYRWQLMKKREAQLAREEFVRLFYVAVTRAEERVILSGSPEEHHGKSHGEIVTTADTWSKWLDGVLGYNTMDQQEGWWTFPTWEGPPIRLLTPQSGKLEELFDTGAGRVADVVINEQEGGEETEIPSQMVRRGWRTVDSQVISVTDLTVLANCPRKFYYAKLLGLPEMANEVAHEGYELLGTKRASFQLDPRMKGEIIHRLVEILPPSPTTLEERDALYQNTFADLGVKPSDYLATMKVIDPFIEAYRRSRFYRDLSNQTGIKREARFIGHTRGLEIEGIIDRIHCTSEGEWELVDYKTNHVSGPRVAEVAKEYLPQLYLYALAAWEEWGIQLTRGILYFLHPDEQIVFEITEGWMDEARQQLDTWAQLLHGKEDPSHFRPQPGKRCTYCPYRMICEGAIIEE